MSGWRARASSVYPPNASYYPESYCSMLCCMSSFLVHVVHVVPLVHMFPPFPNLALLVFGSRVLRGAYVRSDILLLFFMPARPLNVVCMV